MKKSTTKRSTIAVSTVAFAAVLFGGTYAAAQTPPAPQVPPAVAPTPVQTAPMLLPPPPDRTSVPLSEKQAEYSIGPVYMDAPELAAKDDVPQGALYEFTMNSEDSKIYPGIAKNQPGVVPYQRKVVVYVPKQYVPGTPAPFIVAQDGLGYRNSLPKALDTLIVQKRVPVMIAVMINSGGGDSKGSERGLEYDTVSSVYADFVETEVLPYITHHYDVMFTKDPDARATMGGSSGGAAAFTMAWFRPDLYRRVLTYSGTYVDQQSPVNPKILHGAWEYHDSLIKNSKRKPIRIWLHVSENDNGSKLDEASYHNWVMANQRMVSVLKEKGYNYRYVYAKAAGHTDGRVTRQTLPGALEWLWADYKPKKVATLFEKPPSPNPSPATGEGSLFSDSLCQSKRLAEVDSFSGSPSPVAGGGVGGGGFP